MTLSREQIIERIEQTQGMVDLSGLDLRGVDLSSLNLRGADLSRADLTNADLRWTILEGADLHATVLRQADARWSVLRGANLRQADLGRVNLAWADVSGADMTEAKLDGAVVDNVDLGTAFVERRSRAPRGAGSGGAPRGVGSAGGPFGRADDGYGSRFGAAWSAARGEGGALAWLPPLTPATLLGAAAALLVLLQFWGWLYRRSYFVSGFQLSDAGLITFTDPANFVAGLVNVAGLTLGTLVASPLIIVALLLAAALFAAVPVACYLLAQRLLKDTVRSPGRPMVVIGLFAAFFAGFFLLIPPAVQAGGAVGRSLPVSGWLGAVFALWQTGGWLSQLGLAAVLAALLLPLWTIWRLLCIATASWQPPAEWRLRYPALNGAFVQLRGSRLMARNEPLTDVERRRTGLATVAIVLGLATVLTGAGRVFAARDMCDGGRLPRVQPVGKLADTTAGATGVSGGVTRAVAGADGADARLTAFTSQLNPREFCARQLLESDTTHYLFFPSETAQGAKGPMAVIYRVPAASVAVMERGSGEHTCPTCAEGPNGKELALLDPAEGRYEGVFVRFDAATGLLTLEDGSAVRYQAGITRLLSDGAEVDPSALVPGQSIVAYGQLNNLDPSAPVVDAREVRAVTPKLAGTPEPVGGSVIVDISNPRSPLIGGEGWPAGASLAVGIGLRKANLPPSQWQAIPVTQVNAQPDGTFSAPVVFNDQWPVGPNYAVVVKNLTNGETAVGTTWLLEAPPTPFPSPTVRIFSPTESSGDGRATATDARDETPTPQGTNTPLPTPIPPPTATYGPGQGSRFCSSPDDYEPDSSRGQQSSVLVGIGETTETQKHNFCSDFDIDLATFPVKGGRWYKVFTKGLAAGVDTVLAVGDLPGGTNCQPWNPTFGCWSDDATALTFESEVIFQAAGDGQAIVTVDNRGPSAGGGATYELGVVMFERGTATPAPTETPKPSATPTRTPTPMKDSYDFNQTCSSAIPVAIGVEIRAPLTGISTGSSINRDYFKFELEPGIEYRTEMRPPKGMDYDIAVGPWQNSGTCTQYGGLEIQGDDDTERYDWAPVATRTTVYVSVYSKTSVDPSRPYRLITFLKYTTAAPPPLPTATPEPTHSPTPLYPTASSQATPSPAVPSVTPTVFNPILPTVTP